MTDTREPDMRTPDVNADAVASAAVRDGEVTYLEAYAMYLFRQHRGDVVAIETKPGVVLLHREIDGEDPYHYGTFNGVEDVNWMAFVMGFHLQQMPSA